MIKKLLFILICSTFICGQAMAKIKSVDEQRKEWNAWLNALKAEMISKGISKKTIQNAYKDDYFHEVKAVVIKDNKQPEFMMTSEVYINKLINKDKVKKARQHYKDLQKKYSKLSDNYGVPLNYLVSFWAVETHFGYNKGKHHLIDGLTNLSYKNRRAKFFKKELFNVLQIMDTYSLDGDKMMGSWAGAMGHFQFMPSTYNAYAIDYDGDGVADIWDSFDDAIASAANYLSKLGWKANEPWGQEVKLPQNFNYSLVGLRKLKKVSEWKQLGVTSINNKGINLPNDAPAGLILPDGHHGRAYLTLGNFRRIMIWNRSINYALAIVTLADYAVNNQSFQPLKESNIHRLTDKDILKVQQYANRTLKSDLKLDGRYGSKTAEAVRKLQKRWNLPQDGVPDYILLEKITNKKSRNKVVPPQPRKPHLETKQASK